MLEGISNARVLKITFDRKLSEHQQQAFTVLEKRRKTCKVLLGYFDLVHDIEEEQCAICFQNMKGGSDLILRSPSESESISFIQSKSVCSGFRKPQTA